MSTSSPGYKKCLVLDLDETLVHSSFQPVDCPDWAVPIEIQGKKLTVYVLKRPGVDEFLSAVAELFEVVVFTASVANYANPLLDLLDTKKVVAHRLFREGCVDIEGSFVKDLSLLGRDLRHTIIVDNSPTSYMLQPQNAMPISSWFEDPYDRELSALLPILRKCADADNVEVPLARFGAMALPDADVGPSPSVCSSGRSSMDPIPGRRSMEMEFARQAPIDIDTSGMQRHLARFQQPGRQVDRSLGKTPIEQAPVDTSAVSHHLRRYQQPGAQVDRDLGKTPIAQDPTPGRQSMEMLERTSIDIDIDTSGTQRHLARFQQPGTQVDRNLGKTPIVMSEDQA